MAIRHPIKADIDIQNAFRDVEQELRDLKRDTPVAPATASPEPSGPVSLEALLETQIAIPSDGESLTWDETLGAWVNRSSADGVIKTMLAQDSFDNRPYDLVDVNGGLHVAGPASVGDLIAADASVKNLAIQGSVTLNTGTLDHGQLGGLTDDDHTAYFKSGRVTGLTENHGGTICDVNGIQSAVNVIAWIAPYGCTVTAVKGYRVGGTSANINARKNGTSNHLSSDLTVSSADTWTDGGAVQNTDYSAGDKLEIMLTSLTGTVTQIAISVYFTRT